MKAKVAMKCAIQKEGFCNYVVQLQKHGRQSTKTREREREKNKAIADT